MFLESSRLRALRGAAVPCDFAREGPRSLRLWGGGDRARARRRGCSAAAGERRIVVYLTLKDGTSYVGESFGAARDVRGEVVFNTGMTGYVEALTDSSYRGQILVLTYPLQGNYGVPQKPWESGKIQVQGLIVTQFTGSGSHRASVRTLGKWLADEGIPALCGIDTRKLTRTLREYGTTEGILHHAEGTKLGSLPSLDMANAARDVAVAETVRSGSASAKQILLIDTGAKDSIRDSLLARGLGVIQTPFFSNWESLLPEVAGVMLSNGPGDPSDLMPLVARIRTLMTTRLPIFGICLGHQLLALAAGAETYKLPYGHRSQNQPVMMLGSGRTYVTSQNHGYAVRASSLPQDFEPWFVNLNDDTNEGIRHGYRPIRSVQFHPEAAAGPHDTSYLFEDFARLVADVAVTRAS
jgi:carbamoyl-phosphate synthase small subunit